MLSKLGHRLAPDAGNLSSTIGLNPIATRQARLGHRSFSLGSACFRSKVRLGPRQQPQNGLRSVSVTSSRAIVRNVICQVWFALNATLSFRLYCECQTKPNCSLAMALRRRTLYSGQRAAKVLDSQKQQTN